MAAGRGATALNLVYLAVSAVFFAFCAWANLNDPDPILWAGIYIFAGPVLNTLSALGALSSFVVLSAELIAFGCFAYTAYLTNLIVERYGSDFKSWHPAHVLWTYVEYEEGREAAGLVILGLHQFFLVYLASKASRAKGKPPGQQSRLGNMLLASLMLAFFAFLAYSWVYYQPLMNKRMDVEHCKGAFEK